MNWLSKAGEQGDLDAQLSLADINTNEQYNRKDSDLAIKWLKKAAERGDPSAQRRLRTVHAERAHPHDEAEAAYWSRREADTTASSAVTDSSSETAKPADGPPSSKN
ncbi:tetratricopeptide repeat protein [Rhizobium calliandrae]|uniref:tetratricopeptide repeat protein n=1 Tax=Rhizobium calliandrae TaxID=1312182 RepID=UPI003D80AD82